MVISTPDAAERLGGNTQGLRSWSSIGVPASDGRMLNITSTPARHGSNGFERSQGAVTGFVLSIDQGPAIYVSGDTVWYGDLNEIALRFDVRLAVLFAGSAQPKVPFNVTMNTNDAIEAASIYRNAKVVSVHDVGWSHYTQSPEDLATAFDAVGRLDQLHRLAPAVAVDFG